MSRSLFWSWLNKFVGPVWHDQFTSRMAKRHRRRKVAQRCGGQVEPLSQRIMPAQLLNIPDRRDMVYNDADHILYITTAHGSVERFNTDTQTLMTPFSVGTSLLGADVTPDGNWLYVTERATVGDQAFVHKVNLATGAVTDLSFTRGDREEGSFDITILNNGRAFFTMDCEGAGAFVPLRQIDLATGTITKREDLPLITEVTNLERGADRSVAFVNSGGIYGGEVQIYSTATDSFSNRYLAGSDTGYSMASISRDASLFALELGTDLAILTQNGHTLDIFHNLAGGIKFDDHRDLLYVADDNGDEIRVYDTHTFDLKYTVPVEENVVYSVPLDTGEMEAGNNFVFIESLQGIRVMPLPTGTVSGASLSIEGAISPIVVGFGTPITVTARDASGNPLTNYTGTIHFSSDDVTAALPPDYTFTAADQGSHTFNFTFNTQGFHWIAANDSTTAGLSTRIGGLHTVAFPTGPNVLSILGVQDLIYDDRRQMLYMPTVYGSLERYDVQHDVLLPAWRVGGDLFGGDISLDGQYLYVTDETRSAYEDVIHKVNLDTGEVTNLPFEIGSYDDGAYDLNIAANGLGFITIKFRGSGWIGLRQLDTATDTITVRQTPSGHTAEVRQNTEIWRSLDRSFMVLAEGNISNGPLNGYNPTTDIFIGGSTGTFNDGVPKAVNRDGTLFAISSLRSPFTIYDSNLQPIHELLGFGADGATAFDPLRDILYVVSSETDMLMAFDTNTWAKLYEMPFGEDIGLYGQLTVSDDGAHIFFTRQELVRIFDIPAPPALRVDDVSIVEGDNGTKTATLTVTLSQAVQQAVTVDFSTGDGTALAGSDFTAVGGTLTFLPGELTHTFTIQIQGDTTFEPNEAFSVQLSNAQGAVISRGKAQVTITNDDFSPPEFSGLDSSVTFLENTVNAAPQLIDTDVTLTDPDSTSLQGGNLVVAFQSGGSADDQLGIRNQGSSAGQIGVSGATVTFGGVPFATIVSNGANGSALQLNFSSNVATPAVVEALIENLTYRNSSDAPSPTRVLSLVVTDGTGKSSVAATSSLQVTPQNDAPTISAFTSQTINEDSSLMLPFTIGDGDTPVGSLTMNVTSSNQGLVPDANVILGGSGTNRTLTLTPLLNQSGVTTITVTVSDGTLTSTRTFDFHVTPVNDPPTISNIANQSTDEDVTLSSVSFTIGDVETLAGSLTLTATSSNTVLVPNSGIVLGGSGSARTVTIIPAANQSGTATITVTVFDGATSSSDTFDVTVNPIPDAPTITDIGDLSTDEDTATSPLPFSIGDVDSSLASLTVTAESSDQSLVPNANLIMGGIGANRTIKVVPLANQYGTVTITVTVSDGLATSQDTFTLTVTPVDDPPSISNVNNQTILEDTATSLLSFVVDDIDTPANNLIVTASSSDTALVPNGNLVLSGSGATRGLVVTPVANGAGTTTITITVSDGHTTASDTFVLTVVPVNDAPTLSSTLDQFLNEDESTAALPLTIGDLETLAENLQVVATSSNTALIPNGNLVVGGSGANRTLVVTPLANQSGTAVITVSVSDGTVVTQDTFTVTVSPVNDAPNLSTPAAQTIDEDTSTPALPFTISDLETAAGSLTVTASSSLQGLIPDANLVLGGSGQNRTLVVTPVANQSGTAIITLTVSDGAAFTNKTFTVTVSPVNDAPNLTDVIDQSTTEDTTLTGLLVTFGDVDTPAANLTLTASSSNPALVSNSNILISGGGFSRTLTIIPTQNQFGTTTITLTLSDGQATTIDTFILTVSSVNDAPTIGGLLNQTIQEDTSNVPLFVNIGDIDSSLENLILTVVSSNPALIPDANLVISGTGSERQISMTPLANQFGTSTITVTVSDGDQTATTTFLLTVVDVNDAPTISALSMQTIQEDQSTAELGFTIGDLETLPSNLVVTASSSRPELIPAANITFGGSGSQRTVTATPLANQTGLAVITVTVSDGVRSATSSFAVVVTAVNDAPSFTPGSDQVVLEDAAPVVVANWATNISAGPGEAATQTVHFIVSTDHPELFSAVPTISSTGELTYTVAPDANGVAVVTVALQDDGGTDNGGVDTSESLTFTITITPVDDPVELPPETQQQNYSVGSEAVSIDPNLSVTHSDDPNVDFTNTEITVSGGLKKDLLSLPVGKLPKAAHDVIRVGTKVYYMNQQVATLEGGKKGIPLRVKFGPNASEAAVNSVLKALNFKTKGKQPANSTRTLHIAVQNPTNTIHAETTRTIRVTP